MPADLAALVADVSAETSALGAILDPLTEADWRLPTPAPGWSIADQVSHLAYFDEVAVTAATDAAAFEALLADINAGRGADPDTVAARYRGLPGAELLDWFGGVRGRLLAVFAGLDPSARVPWFGPPMSVASSLTARLMETWAHGQDVADTVGIRREPTARLRHVAHIGVGARPFSYLANRLEAPSAPVRVELTAPSGELWAWGPADAADRVTGPALDFCLLVTQRRHRDDTAVAATGAGADHWLSIAQSFAGPPGAGRTPGQFAGRAGSAGGTSA
jgi:uncharacterized protein (TIGR03084 family)